MAVMSSDRESGKSPWKRVGTFAIFAAAYVALFIGVPPVPLCSLGACILNPRPEAFLLAASLPFGFGAILGVSAGVFSAALLYEVIHPTGITALDAVVASLAFLVATWSGRWFLRRVPRWSGAVGATLIITALVTSILGTYAYLLRGSGLPQAYTSVLGEAFIPINVVGALFLSLLPLLRREKEPPETDSPQDG